MSVMSLADAQVADAAAPSQDIPQLAAQILVMREKEQSRLHRIGNYMRGHHDSVYVPRGARDEYKWLIDRSKVNYLPLIVSVVAQNLHVDGYRASAAAPVADDFTVAQALQKAQDALDDSDIAGARGHLQRAAAAGAPKPDNGPWEIWQANRMGSRQHGLHRCIMKYGLAYTVVLPGNPFPVIRPVSPRRLTALYADQVDDEWPVYAVEESTLQTPRGKRRIVTLYDSQNRYILTGKAGSPELGWPEPGDPLLDGKLAIERHGLGVCPVVRFLHEIDLDGDMDVSGEVEPLIEIQDQINTTTFNGLMAQQYGAHRQRWATGMVNLVDEDGNPQEPFRAGVDRLWATEGVNTKFGEFGQTDLSGYLNSREASIRHMSTISQVPPYHLLGQIANLPLALDTIVPTPSGRTMMGDLKRGDKVFAPDGTAVSVKSLSPVFEDHECYRLTFDDGTEVVADAEHRWTTTHFVNPDSPWRGADLAACPECGWLPGTGRAKCHGPVRNPTQAVSIHRRKAHGIATPRRAGGVRASSVVTTRQIGASLHTRQGHANHYIPLASPADGPEQDFAIPPYVLGVWLGDGERGNGYITSHADDVDDTVRNLRDCGEFVRALPYASGNKVGNCWTIRITPDPDRCPYGHLRVATKNGCPDCKHIRSVGAHLLKRSNMSFRQRLKDGGLWKNKHIPEAYFRGSLKQRLGLLQGLMDTDGTVDRRTGYVSIGLHDERLVRDVYRLICSVGHKVTFRDRREYETGMGMNSRRMLAWAAPDPVFRMKRKADLQITDFTRIGDGRRGLSGSAYGRYITKCEPVPSVPVRCIIVDSAEHQFCVTDALIATCNSAEALAAARDGLDRKVEELQGVLSEPHKQNLQLASQAAGDTANASDPHAVIQWRDTGGKAFAATVDALGKLSQMLGVPATELWAKVPGVTTDEVEQWKATATQGDALAMLDQMLQRQGSAGAMPAAAAGPGGQQPGDQNPTPEEPWQTDVHRPLGV